MLGGLLQARMCSACSAQHSAQHAQHTALCTADLHALGVRECPCALACMHSAHKVVAGSSADSVSSGAHSLGSLVCLAAWGLCAAAKVPAGGFG